MKVLPCKFCGAKGVRSNQGGIDGVPEWEVYVTHNDDCIVKYKGVVQDGVTWHPIGDWVNFYGAHLTTAIGNERSNMDSPIE